MQQLSQRRGRDPVDRDEPGADEQSRVGLSHPSQPQQRLEAHEVVHTLDARLPASNHICEAVVPGLVAEGLELPRVCGGGRLKRLQHTNWHAGAGRHSPDRVAVAELPEQQRSPEAGAGGRPVLTLSTEAGVVLHDVDVLGADIGRPSQLALLLAQPVERRVQAARGAAVEGGAAVAGNKRSSDMAGTSGRGTGCLGFGWCAVSANMSRP
eukprot:scaffold12001_cov116-Isochrysis_galbana.AAC.16